MTKEQVSDLKSFIDRVRETDKNALHAELAKKEAERQLNHFLWEQEMAHKKALEGKQGEK